MKMIVDDVCTVDDDNNLWYLMMMIFVVMMIDDDYSLDENVSDFVFDVVVDDNDRWR